MGAILAKQSCLILDVLQVEFQSGYWCHTGASRFKPGAVLDFDLWSSPAHLPIRHPLITPEVGTDKSNLEPIHTCQLFLSMTFNDLIQILIPIFLC